MQGTGKPMWIHMTKAEQINQEVQYSARKAKSAERWRYTRAKSFLPTHVWGCQSRDESGEPPGQLCAKAVETKYVHPSCAEEVGEAPWRWGQGCGRGTGEADLVPCPWGPCAWPVPSSQAQRLWQGALCSPPWKHLCLLWGMTGPHLSSDSGVFLEKHIFIAL